MIKKYYLDNRKYNFETSIKKIVKIDDNLYDIELKETYFYPEGGGQPADRGTIDSLEVVDVQKKSGGVVHRVKGEPKGPLVNCIIDKNHRDHYMVQHTGQHLISAVLKHELDIDTLSVHLGNLYTTIEINRSDILDSEIAVLEDKIYDLISQGNRVIYHETDDEGLKNFNIRRESKYKGYIRIVEIENFDFVPCGGVHLSNIHEIGLIKIVGYDKIRSHIRLNALIGKNAYIDYRTKDRVTNILNKELSTQTEDIPNSISQLKKNIDTLKLDKKNISELYIKKLETEIKSSRETVFIYNNIPKEIVQKLGVKLTNTLTRPTLLINKHEGLNWILIDSKSEEVNYSNFKENLMPLINGKGGGKKSIWQGTGDLDGIDTFIDKFKLLA
ncbi:alanyl-tRNA editing protein [Thiospirochaeta perfilievii]|uniref:alanyl-tRNA editing protein n=1 Tax=Thiospirochaeta perfilievii TaxID=252967 RepID=UPI0016597D69|nr:alanyl-tRNA editing protein [Thiospirochaeta perfilievii]